MTGFAGAGPRIGVDVGGTYTDLVFYDSASGEVLIGKGASTPEAPEDGVLDVLRAHAPSELVGRADLFFHGTTVALNALLQRTGARTALLTTAGFRDVLEIGRGERASVNDLLWTTDVPLVPRRLRVPIRERVRADGAIHRRLDERDVQGAVKLLKDREVESVAIAFLNAYANPEHEILAARILRDAGFGGAISVSHEVSGEYREFERTSTTVIDAFVRPRLARYFGELDMKLGRAGFTGSKLVTRSGGGAMTFPEACRRPFETIKSGTVAGAVGAGIVCEQLGIDRAVTADVGGTSFDASLIKNFRPPVRYEETVLGMPIQASWIDVRSIGAGGGSIATVDHGGLLHVGPESAGASPGPACYGRGGSLATATDAAAALGMLAFGELAGGLQLDLEAARGAVDRLAGSLALDRDSAASGVLTILAANMANLVKQIVAEYGEDAREAQLIAFGGAGPLFATLIARELGVREIVIPSFAGNFSAWALLSQDVTQSASTTSLLAGDREGLEAAGDGVGDLFEILEARARDVAVDLRVVSREVALDIRYAGQEFSLTVPAGSPEELSAHDEKSLRYKFEQQYSQVFHTTIAAEIEIVALRATLRRKLPPVRPAATAAPTGAKSGSRVVDAYSFTERQRASFVVVDRDSVGTRDVLPGPAILVEPTTTTFVDAGFHVRVHESGALLIHDES